LKQETKQYKGMTGSSGEVNCSIICKLGLIHYQNEKLHAWENAISHIFTIVESNDVGFEGLNFGAGA